MKIRVPELNALSWGFFSILITVMILTIFPRSFLSNDDPEILRFISESSYTMFMSPILGKIIYGLGLILPESLNPYGLTLYFFQWFSLFLILFSTHALIKNNKWLWLSSMITILFFTLIIFVRLTFTQTAFLMGFAWGVFGYYICSSKRGFSIELSLLLLASLVGALGLLVRPHSFYCAVIMTVPALVLVAVPLKRKVYVLSILLSLPIIFSVADYLTASSSSPEIKEFNAYNKVRGQIHEFRFNHTPEFFAQLKKADLTFEEWKIYHDDWLFFDQNIFSKEKMETLVVFREKLSAPGIAKFFTALKDLFLKTIPVLLIWISVFFFTKSKYKKFQQVAYFSFVYSVFLALELFFRFPSRVFIPASMGFILFSFFISKDDFELNRMKIVFLIVSLAALVGISRVAFQNISKSRMAHKDFEKAIQHLASFKHHALIIQPSKEWEGLDPLRKDPLMSHKMLSLGCLTFSPLFNRNMAEYFQAAHGKDIFPNIVAKKIPTLIVSSPKWAQKLKSFVKNRYGVDFELVERDKFFQEIHNGKLIVYEVKVD